MACLSWAVGGGQGILSPDHGCAAFEAWARDGATFTGAHIAFDLGVICMHEPRLIPLVFYLLEADRVTDVLLRQKLIDIARLGDTRPMGLVGLAALYKTNGHELLAAEKDDDGPRLGYGKLIGVPLSQWSAREQTYPILDARTTLDVHNRQPDHPTLVDQFAQARGAWFTTLVSARGLVTDPYRVERFRARVTAEHAELRETMKEHGLVHPDKVVHRGKPNERVDPGGRNTLAARAMVERAYAEIGLPVPTTDKGNTSTDRIACEDSGNDTLIDYAHFVALGSIISKDLPILIRGTYEPIHPRYDSIKTTGRTGTSNPNTQNFATRVQGLRECFVPRSGHLFISADFGGLELACWAQICLWMFGRSRLAEALNAGEDGHLMLAATLLGVSYESIKGRKSEPSIKQARNVAKQGNFGFMGGMGIARFVATCRKWGIIIDHEQAKRVKGAWLATWPEARPYLDWASQQSETGAPLVQWVSRRIRKTSGYCDLANSPFQGLGADLAKHVGYCITRACYLETRSPLYGCKPVNFPHDEYILEAPAHRASECAHELQRVMETHCRGHVPDVVLKADPCISRVWSKAAEGVYDSAGRLVPWEEPQC